MSVVQYIYLIYRVARHYFTQHKETTLRNSRYRPLDCACVSAHKHLSKSRHPSRRLVSARIVSHLDPQGRTLQAVKTSIRRHAAPGQWHQRGRGGGTQGRGQCGVESQVAASLLCGGSREKSQWRPSAAEKPRRRVSNGVDRKSKSGARSPHPQSLARQPRNSPPQPRHPHRERRAWDKAGRAANLLRLRAQAYAQKRSVPRRLVPRLPSSLATPFVDFTRSGPRGQGQARARGAGRSPAGSRGSRGAGP